MKLSCVIPSYKEPFLQKTINSLLKNAENEIEVIAVVDGPWLKTPLKDDPRLKVIQFKKHHGMRAAINAGFAKAKGKFVMKADSHCAFGPSFDRLVSENCADDWVVIPRRYSLDETNWDRSLARPFHDYYTLTFPRKNGHYGYGFCAGDWRNRAKERSGKKYDIDETMSYQGSCWLVNKKHFLNLVGLMDDRMEAYGSFTQESFEVGLKYWLSGGKVMCNKKTWYAHLRKKKRHYKTGLYSRRYKKDPRTIKSRTWSAKHWMNDEEPGMKYPISWLIKRFWPIPGWPDNWREVWESYKL